MKKCKFRDELDKNGTPNLYSNNVRNNCEFRNSTINCARCPFSTWHFKRPTHDYDYLEQRLFCCKHNRWVE